MICAADIKLGDLTHMYQPYLSITRHFAHSEAILILRSSSVANEFNRVLDVMKDLVQRYG
jgi:protein-ribulosamine 3-kinase